MAKYFPYLCVLMVIAQGTLLQAASKWDWSKSDLYIGHCILPSSPKIGHINNHDGIFACVKGNFYHDFVSKSKDVGKSQYSHGMLYLGIHTPSLYSFHWSGYLKSDFKEFHDAKFSKTSQLSLIKIGNTAVQKTMLTIGKGFIPFGINQSPSSSFLKAINPDQFWRTPSYGPTLTYDNHINLSHEFAILGGPSKDHLTLSNFSDNRAFVYRFIYDSSAWYGTRYVISALAKVDGKRSYSIGIINHNPNKSISHIEWVRVRETPDGKSNPFKQLLRFSILGPPKKSGRFFLLLDDVRFSHRLVNIGYSTKLLRRIMLNTSFAYKKNESVAKTYHWTLIFGLGFSL